MRRHSGLARWLAAGLALPALAVGLVAAMADPVPVAPGYAEAGVLRARAGLAEALAFADARPDLFPPRRRDRERVLAPEARAELLGTWRSVGDYLLALEAVRGEHADFALRRGDARSRSFHLYRAAFLAQYRHAMDFIERLERDPGFAKVLDEPLPELGLPRGSYARLKLRYLNPGIATEFATLEALAEVARGDPPAALAAGVASDRRRIWRMGRGTGLRLTAENAVSMVERAAFRAWLPVQTEVADWMGDVKVWRRDRFLIPEARREELAARLEPGDVLLTRREWFLSNLGLPGYWSHAALYIGTPAEREAYFDDAGTRQWVREQGEPSGRLGALLARTGAAGHDGLERGQPVRVIEAVGEGVIFTSLTHAAGADSVAVLRPRLPRHEKALALVRAFGYAGRPYDFNFDFVTDAELVCTELVYKAYQPGPRNRGLVLPLESLLGRLALPANGIARLYDAQRDGDARQLDFVLLLDGDERRGHVREADEDVFRASWRRPKWHVLTGETASAL